jgi:hypothetical protein
MIDLKRCSVPTPIQINDSSASRLKRVLRPPDASDFIGLAVSTLAKMRLNGTGPDFVKLSPRAVGYTIEMLVDYAEKRRRKSTSDSGDAL